MKIILSQLFYTLLVHATIISTESKKSSIIEKRSYTRLDILEQVSSQYLKQALRECNIAFSESLLQYTAKEHFFGAAKFLFNNNLYKKISLGSPLLWAILYGDKQSTFKILANFKPSLEDIESEDLIRMASSQKVFAESDQQKIIRQSILQALQIYKKNLENDQFHKSFFYSKL